ncbi:hypothetical protein [Nocardia australiensis]|uniref:hypothetical protein n=1 Tax=Nocardia australiensis TaxID=2887191 RepID=UPI001D14FD1B|nr:hypothetical protein [Nocardia australiensis]
MALKGYRFPISHSEAFPMGLVLVGPIEPLTKYNQDRNAAPEQRYDFDPEDRRRYGPADVEGHGHRSVGDKFQARQLSADLPAEVQRCPLLLRLCRVCVRLSWRLLAEPRVMGQGEFKYQGFNFYAGGIKGDNSGAKVSQPAASKAA